ncbi:MAG TPA: hypothetical protein VFB80_11685 [Pirellulaceae bacterium]|nr:hypothetical protein [Pirellulaceae bacterium]
MSLPDPLHVCVALGPLAMYLIVLGLINLSRRPLLTTGGRDVAALALALGGLVAAGPMELFMVEEAAVQFGGWVWAILLTGYCLGVVLLILTIRPRIIIYNTSTDEIRPILEAVVARLDSEARWAGESLVMPQLGVQLHLESWPMMHNVQLVSAGSDQNLLGWRRLEIELAGVLRKTRHAGNLFGVVAASCGLFLAALLTWNLASNPAAVAQAWNDMLRHPPPPAPLEPAPPDPAPGASDANP